MRNADLIALSLVAAVMAVYVALSGGGDDAIVDSHVVPEARTAELVAIERRAGGQLERFAREADGTWMMVAPERAPLDAAAMRDLRGTLELLRYRRVVPAADGAARGLDPARVVLELGFEGGSTVSLAIGRHDEDTDQTWVARGERRVHYLVDGYAGRALAREGADLRVRRPLPTRYRDVTGVEVGAGDRSVVFSGRPLSLHLDGGGRARVDPEAARSILDRLDDLRLARFVSMPADPPEAGLRVRVIGAGTRELTDHGPCPGVDGERLVDTSVGAGCVAEERLAELALVLDFADRLIDPSLVGLGRERPLSIEIARGDRALVLEAVGGGWQRRGGDEVSHEAVWEWARALAEATAGEPRRVAEDAPVVATASFEYADRTDRVELLDGDLGRRAGEPIAFPLAPGAGRLFDPETPRFRDRAVWSRDPSALRSITQRVGGRRVEVRRGQLLDDWEVRGADLDRDRIGALVEALSRLRARAYTGETMGRVTTVIEVEFADAREVLELDDDCRARTTTDATVFELTDADCALLAPTWR